MACQDRLWEWLCLDRVARCNTGHLPESLSLWEHGLKSSKVISGISAQSSRPSWGRGSPFMGAWIDIDEPDRHWLGTLSSPWRGCAWRELHYGFIVVAFMVKMA